MAFEQFVTVYAAVLNADHEVRYLSCNQKSIQRNRGRGRKIERMSKNAKEIGNKLTRRHGETLWSTSFPVYASCTY